MNGMSKPANGEMKNTDLAFFKTLDIYAGSAELIKRWLMFNIRRDVPCGLFGHAGIGKTQLVRQVAEELDMDVITFYLHHLEREDLAGFPFPDPEDPHGVIMRLKRQIPKKRSTRKGTILFLDEFNRGERPVVAAVFTVMEHPRVLGDFILPDDVRIVLSGNPSDAQYMVNEAEKEPAIRRRVCWAGLAVNHATWLKYAMDHGFHASVINYIRRNKFKLYDFDAHAAGRVAANPASWEKASRAIQDAEQQSGGNLREMADELRVTLAGIVGMSITTEFMPEVLKEDAVDKPTPEEILLAEHGFTPEDDVYHRVKKMVANKTMGVTGSIGSLAAEMALTIAVTQYSPASVAGPLARFTSLLFDSQELLASFMRQMHDLIKERDREGKYHPLLTNALKEQPLYMEAYRRAAQSATSMNQKISIR